MSSNEYAAEIEKRNPKLFKSSDQKIKMSAAEFKLQIKKAFEAGELAGRSNAGPKSLFEAIFG